ncbi:glycine cleavage system protein H [Bacillota bacterium LX-D]|nr:glycine cleavage system protein H [Bacillota bacterium LX-D]
MDPTDRLYTKEQVWLLILDKEIAVGVTRTALQQCGKILYVDYPQEDQYVQLNEHIVVIEGELANIVVQSPVQGQITAVNEGLADSPELLKLDPYDLGWLVRIESDGKVVLDKECDK